MSFEFPYDEALAEVVRKEHSEILGVDEEGNPDFGGEDWVKKVYAGEVDVPVGFAFDEHFILVGKGSKTNDKCGSFGLPKVKYLVGCLRLKNHAKVGLDGVDYTGMIAVRRVFHSCDKPECPSCFLRGWAVRSAQRAGRILTAGALKYGLKVEHIVVSPPQSDSLSFDKIRKLAMDALRVRGVVGGCWIYHHFRYRNPEVARKTGLKLGWYRSPHFHVLGFVEGGYGCRGCKNCYVTRKGSQKVINRNRCFYTCNGFEGVTRRQFKKDGCIVVVMGERKTVGGTLWYQLSHASIEREDKKHRVLRWFGNMNGRNFKVTKELKSAKVELLCPICGEPEYRVVTTGTNADFADVLRWFAGKKNGDHLILPAKDACGEWMWKAVYDEGKSCKKG